MDCRPDAQTACGGTHTRLRSPVMSQGCPEDVTGVWEYCTSPTVVGQECSSFAQDPDVSFTVT